MKKNGDSYPEVESAVEYKAAWAVDEDSSIHGYLALGKKIGTLRAEFDNNVLDETVTKNTFNITCENYDVTVVEVVNGNITSTEQS